MKIKNKKLYALFKLFLCFMLIFAMVVPSVTDVVGNGGGSQGGGSNGRQGWIVSICLQSSLSPFWFFI